NDFGEYQGWAQFFVTQAKNGNTQGLEGTILERGRYFTDSKGTTLSSGNKYDITIYDYGDGNQDDILMQGNDGPFGAGDLYSTSFYHGCEVDKDTPTAGEFTIIQTDVSHFDTLSKVTDIFNERLYGQYY